MPPNHELPPPWPSPPPFFFQTAELSRRFESICFGELEDVETGSVPGAFPAPVRESFIASSLRETSPLLVGAHESGPNRDTIQRQRLEAIIQWLHWNWVLIIPVA